MTVTKTYPSKPVVSGGYFQPMSQSRAHCGILVEGRLGLLLNQNMIQIPLRDWQIAGAAAGVAVIAGAVLWWLNRKRPTADEIEQERRAILVSYGRIVDGSLIDGFDITAEDGATRHMLLYTYEISGVQYECSQDITTLSEIVDPATVKIGMPCSIRYQPGTPENSILIAERWSGLRDGVPVLWLSPRVKN